MMKRFSILVIMVAMLSCMSFPIKQLHSKQIRKQVSFAVTSPPDDQQVKETNGSRNFFSTFFSSFANIFKPIKSEMDPKNVVEGLKKFDSGSNMSDLRKKYKAVSEWDKSDIVQNFADKFIPNHKSSAKTSRLLQKIKDMSDEDDVLISLDEYDGLLGQSEIDPVTATERFVNEALMAAASPLKPIDKAKLVKSRNRMFFKPVQMSRLHKVLTEDPDYFEK